MIIKLNSPHFRSRIALFDFDWTLVKPKTGGIFPKNEDDWEWLSQDVPDYIKSCYKKGYGIYIVTNQTKQWKKTQIEKAMIGLGIPLTICIAWDKTKEHKPNTFLFHEAFTESQMTKLKLSESFMIGDAQGRPNDHSDCDLVFAKSVGVKCLVPEDVFKISDSTQKTTDVQPSMNQEVVILVGYPGSGKSTLCEKVFSRANYVCIKGDEFKTSVRMIKEAEQHVQIGKSVVFDATNPSIKKRAEYIAFARKHSLSVRCIFVSTSFEISFERNNKRAHPIPRIAYNLFKKNFEYPSENEGFTLEIINT